MKPFKHVAGGIDWYCELRGNGPTIALIPSGEGDCGSLTRVADALSDEFTVLSFDMPGFSRSTAPSDLDTVTVQLLAEQIAALVKSLHLVPATFYGCSSGGQAVLSLVTDHADVVRNGIVHEAALVQDYAWPEVAFEAYAQLNALDDDKLVERLKDRFRNDMNQDPEAWDALGHEYHQRLEKNYVTWARYYLRPGMADRTYSAEELSRRPIAWSIGGFSQVWLWIGNERVARRANIDVEILKCKHFPQVSIPDMLAERIREHARLHL